MLFDITSEDKETYIPIKINEDNIEEPSVDDTLESLLNATSYNNI